MTKAHVQLATVMVAGLLAGPLADMRADCGGLDSPYGINAHAPQGASLSVLLDEVQACGIGWIRVDFVWAWAEPSQNGFAWGIYDDIAAAAEARGINVFATIGHTPSWATSGAEGSGVPSDPADFHDICYRAAERYDGFHGQSRIEYWGMWNEPNLDGFWEGTRQEYIDVILKNGADAVHAANPYANVCGPELAHLTSGDQDWYAWLEDCIVQAGDRLDVVTHHVYCSSGYGSCTDKLEDPPFWPWDPPSVKQVLQDAGWFGKPFWITETGWQSEDVGEAEQAANYAGLLTDWLSGQTDRDWVHRVFFYELSDSTAFADLSWGIVGPDPTYARKQAFTAYQDFIIAHPPSLNLPCPALDPEPQNLAIEVGLNADLSWTPGDGAQSHDVYFGTSDPGTFRGNQEGATFDPGTLEPNRTYFWRIDEVNLAGTTTGQAWSFTATGSVSYRGDMDEDRDVDQEDFGRFQACLSGAGEPYQAGCDVADFDANGSVDEGDFDLFRACMSGPSVLPDVECLE